MDKTTQLLLPVYRVTLASMNSETTTSSSSGGTFFSGSLFDGHPMIAFIICFVVSLLILATLIGNAMVCLAIFMVRKLKSQPANLLLISLAMADLGVGFCVMPIALINIVEDKWILGLSVFISSLKEGGVKICLPLPSSKRTFTIYKKTCKE